ncbi:MAG: hypothetical protein RIR11_5160 [Bacteroidota bacterium]|jgi:hypothetical protein
MKYTNIIYLLLAFLCFTKCRVDKDASETPISVAGAHLNCEVIKKYLPSALFSGKKILYLTEAGDSLLLYSTFAESTTTRTTQNKEQYTSESFTVRLYDPNNTKFRFDIIGGTNYGENAGKYEIVRGISVLFYSGEVSPVSGDISLDGNGHLTNIIFYEYYPTISLLNKTFSECVKIGTGYTQTPLYAFAYLNSKEGIPAFADKNGKLYVFQQFVD